MPPHPSCPQQTHPAAQTDRSAHTQWLPLAPDLFAVLVDLMLVLPGVAVGLQRSARIPNLRRKAIAAEVKAHLNVLVALSCFCLHTSDRTVAPCWLPLIASGALELLAWHGHRTGGVRTALMFVGDGLRQAAQMEQALHVYFSLYDSWFAWPAFDQARSCSLRILNLQL
jgi:hypothetical protein